MVHFLWGICFFLGVEFPPKPDRRKFRVAAGRQRHQRHVALARWLELGAVQGGTGGVGAHGPHGPICHGGLDDDPGGLEIFEAFS